MYAIGHPVTDDIINESVALYCAQACKLVGNDMNGVMTATAGTGMACVQVRVVDDGHMRTEHLCKHCLEFFSAGFHRDNGPGRHFEQ